MLRVFNLIKNNSVIAVSHKKFHFRGFRKNAMNGSVLLKSFDAGNLTKKVLAKNDELAKNVVDNTLTRWMLRRSKYLFAASIGCCFVDGLTYGFGLLSYIVLNEFGHSYTRKALNVSSTPIRLCARSSYAVPLLRVETPRSSYEELMVACGGAAGGLVGAFGMGLAGVLVESEFLLEIGYFGATFAVCNIALPLAAFDCGRYFQRFPFPFWMMQGVISALSTVVVHDHPVLFAASVVVVGANVKEWWYRQRKRGYYNVSGEERSRVFCGAFFALCCSSLYFNTSDWLWDQRETAFNELDNGVDI